MKSFLVLLSIFLYFTTFSQCSQYAIYESFGATTTPTQGGTWTQNSVITLTSPVRTGIRAIGFNATGDWIRLPLATNPGTLSFWYRRSSNSTAWSCVIQTSPDNTTWTTRGTISSATTTYQQYSLNLSSLTNVYIRIRDNRVSGTHERYIDDLGLTSTVAAQNNLIPFLSSCSCTMTLLSYDITDIGGSTDEYSSYLSQTVTFTPPVGYVISLQFTSFSVETGYDFISVYNGSSTSSPLVGTYDGTSLPAAIIVNGPITIFFSTDVNNIGAWTGFIGKVEAVSALPITMLYFEGSYKSNYNVLNWVTASEHNSDYFRIEKSEDGIEWEIIGMENGAGNSTIQIDYRWEDYNVTPLINYYRLRQVDFNGEYVYYGPISIDNNRKLKKVVKVVNILGQDTKDTETGVLIEIYEDGTTRKIIR